MILFLGLVAAVIIFFLVGRLLRALRPGWFYARLPGRQLQVVAKYFQFYGRLTPPQQRRFEHLVASFVNDKEWKGIGIEVKEEMQVMIGASAAQIDVRPARSHADAFRSHPGVCGRLPAPPHGAHAPG
jgi:hypothetical protein